MGVFGAVFGCRGDVRFSGPLLEVSSGVVGFNVAALSRQPVLRPGLVGDAVHFRVAAVGGFAPCEAL